MATRADELIELLELVPHPEGGYFREVFRSPAQVLPADSRPARSALTTIYFLLTTGQHSSVHWVESDEVWHYYEGDPLELRWWTADWQLAGQAVLGPAGGGRGPVAVVPGRCWQAAWPAGSYTLVGCSVGPGFEFDDFRMLRDDPAADGSFRQAHPHWAHLI